MALGVVTTILGFLSGNKKYKKDCEERITKYNSYIDKKKHEIEIKREEEEESLRDTYCDVASDVDTAMNFDRRLFERTREDADFLCVYLGKGSVESERQIDYRKQERMEVGDELTDLPEKICDMYAKIRSCPCLCRFEKCKCSWSCRRKKGIVCNVQKYCD